jgi:23S rRNA G2069 N7-methylase RlmK/C1962 C5-methylase RlmI
VETLLEGMIQAQEKYDFVVCDPPALVKSSKKKFAGLRKMRQGPLQYLLGHCRR